MSPIHAVLAWAVIALNLAVGVWGLRLSKLAQAGAPRPKGVQFWPHVLASAQSVILLEGLLGVMMLGSAGRPDDPLHGRVYGPFMVIAYMVTYGMRTEDEAANLKYFAVCGFVVAALGVRAVWTG